MLDVREEPAAQNAVDLALRRWPRAQDAWDAVTWVIARDPEAGVPLTESGRTRSLTSDGARSIGLPTVTVVYVIEAAVIAVHAAQFSDAVHARAGHA